MPAAFREAVAGAEAADDVAQLGLLAAELDELAWRREGRRLVGRALVRLGAVSRARELWNELSRAAPADAEAREVLAALAARGAAGGPRGAARRRVIVATGHRVDAAGRKAPRFPRTAAAREAARAALAEAVRREFELPASGFLGLAAAASGADLLFHDVAEELGLATRVLLPIPRQDFFERSVEDGGAEWAERFRRVCGAREVRVLSSSPELPSWLGERSDYSVFQRGNLWLLESAFAEEAADVTLLALWNGESGDGPGGTADMVGSARARGARVVVLDAKAVLLGPA